MTVRKILLGWFLLLALAVRAETITIATGEYPPWTGADLPHSGYVNHLIAEAFASVGIEVEFVYMPWKRAFEESRRGVFDATSYWLDSTERRETMLFSEPLIQNRTVFFQRIDTPPVSWKILDDLADYRISATVGFTYTDEFYEAIDKGQLQVTMVPTDLQNLKMLMSDRVDLMATDEVTGFYMAAMLSVDPRRLRVLEPPLSTANGFLMATRQNANSEAIIEAFNQGLRAIKANGRYREILYRVDAGSFYNPAPVE